MDKLEVREGGENKNKLSPISKSPDVYKRKEIEKKKGKYNLGGSVWTVVYFLFVSTFILSSTRHIVSKK